MAYEWKLKARPYSDDDAKKLLANVVSPETTDWHYNTHHKGYVTALNNIEKGLETADRAAANDILLDHNVCRPANDQQMLDVVATDQDQPPPGVNRGCVDHSKSGLAPTRSGGPQVRGTEASCQPCE